jgi:hypothetical protein
MGPPPPPLRGAAEPVPLGRGRPAPPERVRSLLVIEDALKVASQGIDRNDPDLVLSLLTLDWTPGEDGTGRITLILAGDGAVAVDVEALEVTLRDVTTPYVATSGKVAGPSRLIGA